MEGCSDREEMEPEKLRTHIVDHLGALAHHAHTPMVRLALMRCARRHSFFGTQVFFCPWVHCETSCVNRGNLQRHIVRVIARSRALTLP